MKRLLLASLLLGSVSVAQAQVSAPILQIDRGNAAPDFSATSAARVTLLSDLAAADSITVVASKPANTFAAPTVATALALPLLRRRRSLSFSTAAVMTTAGNWVSP